MRVARCVRACGGQVRVARVWRTGACGARGVLVLRVEDRRVRACVCWTGACVRVEDRCVCVCVAHAEDWRTWRTGACGARGGTRVHVVAPRSLFDTCVSARARVRVAVGHARGRRARATTETK